MSDPGRIDCATRWVLARAFLPVERPLPPPEDPIGVWRAAQRLRLAPRVASRSGAERLTRELGASVAERFRESSRQAAMQAVRTEALVRRLSAVAREAGLRFAVLKGGALHLRRIVAVGARPLCDLDILMPRFSARRFEELLRGQGWRRTTSRRMDYHLPPLRHPAWPLVEIHDYLPWVALNGRTWSTFEQLEAEHRLEVLPAPLDNVLTPDPAVLASHAAVAAPWLSAFGFADVAELARSCGGTRTRAVPVGRWLRPTIGDRQLATLESLLAGWLALTNGRPRSDGADEEWLAAMAAIEGVPVGAPRTLLRPLPGSPHPWRGVAQRLMSRVLVSRYELDVRYGRPSAPWHYPALQFRRWCEIVGRKLRSTGTPAARSSPTR